MTASLKTPHFTLAAYIRGDSTAERIALCLPGYCDTKDYPDMRTHVELLASRGYYAITFDPPGTWESTGDISLYTTTNYLLAINELIAYFGDRPTLLIGKSMGGRMAQLAAQNSAVIGFVSVVGAASSAVTNARSVADWSENSRRTPHRDLPHNPKQFRDFLIPYTFVEDSLTYDALDVVDKLVMPKLYIAGENDPLVPPRRLKEAYDAAAESKEFVVLPMDHDYRRSPEKLQLVNTTIADFLVRHHL
ncbi:MAG TPA: alpha/beta hydrolase [Patescibacteria group bacterium]|nr:alpha/beta hydrolase [Patescibacteria group bacterium]